MNNSQSQYASAASYNQGEPDLPTDPPIPVTVLDERLNPHSTFGGQGAFIYRMNGLNQPTNSGYATMGGNAYYAYPQQLGVNHIQICTN